MPNYSRRKFLKQIGAFSTLFLASRDAFSLPNLIKYDKDFEMLVVGDSLIAGQGLKKEDKFITLTKKWLEIELFKGKRKVNLKNKSHSGARIYLSEKEKKALKKAGKDLDKFYHPEVNFSFPSMKTQVEVATKEYEKEGKSTEDVNLILLTGGLTNLDSSYIINPFNKNKTLREKIDEFCNHMMFNFLQITVNTFPNALITVVGYFPMVSKYSSTGKIYNSVLELYGLPRPIKPVMNNILTKQLFKPLHHKMNRRSRIWLEGSNKALQTAVQRINKLHNKQKAIFVKSPIKEENAYGTKNTLLFGMAKKGRTEDPNYDERVRVCGKTIKEMKDVELKFKTRFCELSGIGHPNVAGSQAYAEAIKKRLKSELSGLKII